MNSFLTQTQLCQQSGLSLADLAKLEAIGLLRPTWNDPPAYRPKLASWSQKLAYLLAVGWTVDEIKQWSNERWSWVNPRQWPPPKPKKRPS